MTALPEVLSQTRDDFLSLSDQDKIQLLIEFAEELPELPDRYKDHPELFEKVEECQSPVHIFVEVEQGRISVFATAPEQAPTTRGFASILVQGFNNLTPEQALEIPDDFPSTLGLNQLISPLRVRGMTGMLWRIKRQIREKTA